MYKILISGYYGFNNIGDESILRTVIDNLREKLPDVRSEERRVGKECRL